MNLEIDINNGIMCMIISKKNKLRYIYGREINLILKELTKEKYKNVEIINGSIQFNVETMKVTINNYKQNNNKYLEKIIEELKQVKIKETRKKLKGKKINRKNKILKSTLVLSLATATLLTFSNYNVLSTTEDKYTYENTKIFVETENQIVSEQNLNEDNIRIKNFNIDCYDRTDSEKFAKTKATYFKTIEQISKKYGIDPQIMLAIATQERGIHSEIRDYSAMGLMQIEVPVWNNQNLTAFNYEKNQYETIYITEEKLKDLEFNITTACMIFQQCLKFTDYNLPLAIQTYNYGQGNITSLLRYCQKDINKTEKEIINDENCEWLNYRQYISNGDKEYLEHVLSYIENKEEIICNIDQSNKMKCSINHNKKINSMI